MTTRGRQRFASCALLLGWAATAVAAAGHPQPAGPLAPVASKHSPLATTDITNLPGLITSQYGNKMDAEGIDKAIDNLPTTKFLEFHSTVWIKFQQTNPSVVTSYTITSANDDDTRDPKAWTFEGSTDDVSWTTLDTRTNEDFPTRLLKREFSFSNTKPFTYYRLSITNHGSTLTQLAEWEIFGTGGGGAAPPPPLPPATWQEHWFEHNQLLTRVFYDDDVAVYYDKDVDRSVTWPFKYTGDLWRYTKRVYGEFGKDKRAYAVLHTGRYPGGHPATYFDSSHDYRNVSDVGPGPWTNDDYTAHAITTHEFSHIVEGGSKGVHNSPAFGLWGDSKWAEIYVYDAYKGLGFNDYATRWYNEQLVNSDNFPRANTHWFRDWFYPIYSQYGQSQVLNNYFTILAKCFPKNDIGDTYARSMNWGEFVHFWSGAAGVNLKPLATNAFGWPADWEAQFKQAQADFPCVTYGTGPLATKAGNTPGAPGVSIWYNPDAKVVSIVDEASQPLAGGVSIYSMVGAKVLKTTIKSPNGVALLDAAHLAPGVYVVHVEAGKQVYRKSIAVY